jgi:hypothetical protein
LRLLRSHDAIQRQHGASRTLQRLRSWKCNNTYETLTGQQQAAPDVMLITVYNWFK